MRELALGGATKAVIGMVHLPPLPGTPYYEEGGFSSIIDDAVHSARALEEGGATGCLIQTVDRVYPVDDESDPARTVAMGLIVREIAMATADDFCVGVQLMRNAVRTSLAVAKVAGGSFVRAGAVVGMTLTPHGMVTADPLGVMEYRAKIHARPVRILADIDSMHFTWFGGDKTTAEVARAASLVGADAVVVAKRDEARLLDTVSAIRSSAPDLPILLGGYTDHDNAARLLAVADGAFVGSCLERDGWGGRIDVERVRAYMDVVRTLGPRERSS